MRTGEQKLVNIPTPNPNLTTADVLEALRASGKPLQEWGQAVDGTPMLAARAGGDKQPAIFITAGAHAAETAGVHAALSLLHALDTEHEVHVLPLRDPLGFAGVNHCLSFAAGQSVEIPNHRAALDYLLAHGQLLWHRGEMYLFQLGDVGFMWNTPTLGSDGSRPMNSCVRSLMQEDPDVLEPLWDKSVMLILAMVDVEGSGELQRCWHGVMSREGEWLHLNRFFGRDDAPPEVAAVDRLMQAVRPGLTCDLHEGAEQGFWLPIPRPKGNPERVFEMTRAYFDYIHSRGYPITTYEEWVAIHHVKDEDRVGPEPRLPGLLWTHVSLAGEGHNLGSYANDLFGVGFDTEAPLVCPLAMRVDGITNGVLAAIQVWEQTV
jgi:hypothetical protein